MSKIRNGLPPERTALDRVRSRPCDPAARPRTCCAVFLRELSKIIQSCRCVSTRRFRLAVDCAGSRKERLLFGLSQGLSPNVGRFTSRGQDSRPFPRCSAKLSNILKRDDFAPGGLTALLEFSGTSDTACPRTPFCNGLFGMAQRPVERPASLSVDHAGSEPAAKPLCYCVDS